MFSTVKSLYRAWKNHCMRLFGEYIIIRACYIYQSILNQSKRPGYTVYIVHVCTYLQYIYLFVCPEKVLSYYPNLGTVMVKNGTFVYYRFLMSTVVTSILWAQEVQITLPMPFLTSDFVYPYLVVTTLPQLYGGKFKVDEIFSVIEIHSITASLSLSDLKKVSQLPFNQLSWLRELF